MSTQTPTTAPAQKSNSSNIDQNYYQNSAFIGNSFVDGMMNYSLVEGVDYFARIGLNVNDAMTKSTSTVQCLLSKNLTTASSTIKYL